MPPSAEFPRVPGTDMRRADRGSYSRAVAYEILDEGFVAHVGIAVDGQPFVLPMVYGRRGDELLLHGSVASRLCRALDHGAPVCVTVTLVDGLVLARSQRNHSANYRCVVVLGTATRVRDPEQARAALGLVIDHVVPGRSAESRPPTDVEVRETAVLRLPIETASVKARTGEPGTDPGDADPSVWAGVLPLAVVPGVPAPDGLTASGVDAPASVTGWRRPRVSR